VKTTTQEKLTWLKGIKVQQDKAAGQWQSATQGQIKQLQHHIDVVDGRIKMCEAKLKTK